MAAAGLAACGGSEETPPPRTPRRWPTIPRRARSPRGRSVLSAPCPRRPRHPTTRCPLPASTSGACSTTTCGCRRNHDIACNSCHPLSGFGADGEATSPGHQGQRGDRNSPTSLNAALHIAQFWDGRAADVEEQAKGPILNPVEMAMPSEAAVVAMLKSIPDYPGLFAAAFPDSAEDAVTYDHMATAIGAFERGLVTPGPFDDFLGGDYTALSPDAQKGLELFLDVGCIACHVGPAVGGGMHQKLGLIEPYETRGHGPPQGHGQRRGQVLLQGPVAAQRRGDRPLPPRRKRPRTSVRWSGSWAAISSARTSTPNRCGSW